MFHLLWSYWDFYKAFSNLLPPSRDNFEDNFNNGQENTTDIIPPVILEKKKKKKNPKNKNTGEAEVLQIVKTAPPLQSASFVQTKQKQKKKQSYSLKLVTDDKKNPYVPISNCWQSQKASLLPT